MSCHQKLFVTSGVFLKKLFVTSGAFLKETICNLFKSLEHHFCSIHSAAYFKTPCHTYLFVSCGTLLKHHFGLFVQLLYHHSKHHSILAPGAYKEGDKCCDHQVSTGSGLFWCNSLVWRGVIANATLLTIGSFVCNTMDPASDPTPSWCIKQQELFLKLHQTQP